MLKKIHIYCLPGLGASPKIFNRICLPYPFEMHFLEWEEPKNAEQPIAQYAQKIARKITEPLPVLMGVSFGGIVMQEVAKIIPYQKIILISSVKTQNELPPWLRLLGILKLYHLLPTSLLCNEKLYQYFKRGRNLYLSYMQKNTPLYLQWAVKNVVCWQQKTALSHTIHIQGGNDVIFPIGFIKKPIVVEKGSHIMIINRFKWFCEHLPSLILEDNAT